MLDNILYCNHPATDNVIRGQNPLDYVAILQTNLNIHAYDKFNCKLWSNEYVTEVLNSHDGGFNEWDKGNLKGLFYNYALIMDKLVSGIPAKLTC